MDKVQLLGGRRRAMQFACSTIACLSCGFASAPLRAQSTTTRLSFIRAIDRERFAVSSDLISTFRFSAQGGNGTDTPRGKVASF